VIPEVLTGSLVVATPRMADRNFARRVVLVLDHGDHGSLGVVLNHPGGVLVDQVLPAWRGLTADPGELFTGGPVARSAVIGLVRMRQSEPLGGTWPEGWKLLVEGVHPVGTVDLAAEPTRYAEDVMGVRLFSGYAGWAAEQLEREIAEGSWYVVPCEEHDPVTDDPDGLWRRVLRRQGGALALVSGYPENPSLN
jgi:putative transcriptional regulator